MIHSNMGVGFSLHMPFYNKRLLIDDDNVNIILNNAPELHFGCLYNNTIPLSLSSEIFLDYLKQYLSENIDHKL